MIAKAAAVKNQKGKWQYYLTINNIQGLSATYMIRKAQYDKLENMQIHENQIIKEMEKKLDKAK